MIRPFYALSLITIILFLFNTCTTNTILGNTKNLIAYGQTFEDTLNVNIQFSGKSANQEYIKNMLLHELESRKLALYTDGDFRFTIVIDDWEYQETPSTDTETDKDGYYQTINTTDYYFYINGTIIDYDHCTLKHFSASVRDGTRAGIGLFGGVVEKGIISSDWIYQRCIYRFSGKAVQHIQKLQSAASDSETRGNCDSIFNTIRMNDNFENFEPTTANQDE